MGYCAIIAHISTLDNAACFMVSDQWSAHYLLSVSRTDLKQWHGDLVTRGWTWLSPFVCEWLPSPSFVYSHYRSEELDQFFLLCARFLRVLFLFFFNSRFTLEFVGVLFGCFLLFFALFLFLLHLAGDQTKKNV